MRVRSWLVLAFLFLVNAGWAAVTSEVSRTDYVGNGSVAAYATTFPVKATSELRVFTQDADGEDVELTLGADYSAVLNAAGLCTVTLTAGNLTSGYKLSLQRGIPYTQTYNPAQSGAYNAASLGVALDRLAMEVIRLKGDVARSIKIPYLEAGGDSVTKLSSDAATRANQFLGFDSSGNAMVGATVDGVTASPFAQTLLDDTTADAARTTLGLPSQAMAARTVVANDTSGAANGTATTIDSLTLLSSGSTTRRSLATRSGETRNVLDFGATGLGAANDAAAIQSALTLGGDVLIPTGTYYLGRTALTVGSNTRVIMEPGARFTVDESVAASMAEAYVVVDGDNVELKGLAIEMTAGLFSGGYTPSGIFIALRTGSENVLIQHCRSLWPMHSVWGVHVGTNKGDNLRNIRIVDNTFVSFDADIYLTGDALADIVVSRNVFNTARPAYVRAGGSVFIAPAVDLANPAVFNQADYDSNCGSNIFVCNNLIDSVDGRPIRIHNCKQVTVCKNTLNLTKGTYTTAGVSDDVIALDMLRGFVCSDNIIEGGGENGIDILSCHDGVVSGNTIKQCDTVGIFVNASDVWVSSGSTPKLSGITDRLAIQVRNVEVFGNTIEAYWGVLVGAGQGVRVHHNTWKPYHGSTNNISANTPFPIVIEGNTTASLFAESPAYWMTDLTFSDNRLAKITPVSVTADAATDVLTSVAPHGLQTGDYIDLVAGGTSTTVDFPGGINYYQSYHVIRLTATTFKIATTRANAYAGTAVNITSNGLATAGAALLTKSAVRVCSVDLSPSYYSHLSGITLDEEFPFLCQTELFSTMGSIATGTTVLLSKSSNEYLFDPAVAYGGGPEAKGVYGPLLRVNAVKTSDGTNAFGIEPYIVARSAVIFSKAAGFSIYPGTPADGYIRTKLW